MSPLQSSNDDPIVGLNQLTGSHAASRAHSEKDREKSIRDPAGGVRVKNRSRKAERGEGRQPRRERSSIPILFVPV